MCCVPYCRTRDCSLARLCSICTGQIRPHCQHPHQGSSKRHSHRHALVGSGHGPGQRVHVCVPVWKECTMALVLITVVADVDDPAFTEEAYKGIVSETPRVYDATMVVLAKE